MRDRLNLLHVSPMPPSPPRFGAQARMHGLMTSLARHHDITAVSLVDEGFDIEECRRAMRAYCREVILVPNPRGKNGAKKRALQLRSLASRRSFERHRCAVPALQSELDRLLSLARFDVVNLEFPYLAHFAFDRTPPGTPPLRVLDAHEIAHDMVRQFARRGRGLGRELGRGIYASINWRKLRGEELDAFRRAHAIDVCSVADQQRVLAEVPAARTAVVPNAADVEFYRRRSEHPRDDGRTVVFFGLLSTLPNIDGITWFIQEIWPRILSSRPDARCKIIGQGATGAVRALAGPGVEVVGFVEDLRPHLASAAALVVPLRLGGGTRLKIVEGMAMGKAIVSTTLGAEGIDVQDGRELLIADDPRSFSDAVLRLMNEPTLATEMGASARRVAVERYAWASAAKKLEDLFEELIAERARGDAPGRLT